MGARVVRPPASVKKNAGRLASPNARLTKTGSTKTATPPRNLARTRTGVGNDVRSGRAAQSRGCLNITWTSISPEHTENMREASGDKQQLRQGKCVAHYGKGKSLEPSQPKEIRPKPMKARIEGDEEEHHDDVQDKERVQSLAHE